MNFSPLEFKQPYNYELNIKSLALKYVCGIHLDSSLTRVLATLSVSVHCVYQIKSITSDMNERVCNVVALLPIDYIS